MKTEDISKEELLTLIRNKREAYSSRKKQTGINIWLLITGICFLINNLANKLQVYLRRADFDQVKVILFTSLNINSLFFLGLIIYILFLVLDTENKKNAATTRSFLFKLNIYLIIIQSIIYIIPAYLLSRLPLKNMNTLIVITIIYCFISLTIFTRVVDIWDIVIDRPLLKINSKDVRFFRWTQYASLFTAGLGLYLYWKILIHNLDLYVLSAELLLVLFLIGVFIYQLIETKWISQLDRLEESIILGEKDINKIFIDYYDLFVRASLVKRFIFPLEEKLSVEVEKLHKKCDLLDRLYQEIPKKEKGLHLYRKIRISLQLFAIVKITRQSFKRVDEIQGLIRILNDEYKDYLFESERESFGKFLSNLGGQSDEVIDSLSRAKEILIKLSKHK